MQAPCYPSACLLCLTTHGSQCFFCLKTTTTKTHYSWVVGLRGSFLRVIIPHALASIMIEHRFIVTSAARLHASRLLVFIPHSSCTPVMLYAASSHMCPLPAVSCVGLVAPDMMLECWAVPCSRVLLCFATHALLLHALHATTHALLPCATPPGWNSPAGLRCLPYAYIMGSFQAGANTLYHKVSEHPDIASVGIQYSYLNASCCHIHTWWLVHLRRQSTPNIRCSPCASAHTRACVLEHRGRIPSCFALLPPEPLNPTLNKQNPHSINQQKGHIPNCSDCTTAPPWTPSSIQRSPSKTHTPLQSDGSRWQFWAEDTKKMEEFVGKNSDGLGIKQIQVAPHRFVSVGHHYTTWVWLGVRCVDL